jgi:hypothetical protein
MIDLPGSATIDYVITAFVPSPDNVPPNPAIDESLNEIYDMTGELIKLYHEATNPDIRALECRRLGVSEQRLISDITKRTTIMNKQITRIIGDVLEYSLFETKDRWFQSDGRISLDVLNSAIDKKLHKSRNVITRLTMGVSLKIKLGNYDEMMAGKLIAFRTDILTALVSIQTLRENLFNKDFINKLLREN